MKLTTDAIPNAYLLMGEITSLLQAARFHRHYTLGDVRKRFLPPVTLNQFRLYRNELGPVGVVTWAFVSDEIDAALSQGPTDIDPDQWASGAHVWYMDFVAPYGHAKQVVRDLRDTVFKDLPVGKSHKISGHGKSDWLLRHHYGLRGKPIQGSGSDTAAGRLSPEAGRQA